MAKESFNKVFAELAPGRACSRIVRVERILGVAVLDHVGKFLEVAKADSDGADGKDCLVDSSHVLHALLLTAKVLSAGLAVTVSAVESCFDMFDISRGHNRVSVSKEGKDGDGVGKKDTGVIIEVGREVFGNGFLEVLNHRLCDVEAKVEVLLVAFVDVFVCSTRR